MMLTITEDQMILHANDATLAGATHRPDGRWDVPTWPVPPKPAATEAGFPVPGAWRTVGMIVALVCHRG
jgi:hypothetical protein